MDEKHIFFIPKTIFGSSEWIEIENRENSMGPDAVLEELMKKKILSNAEILWIIKRLIYFYGKKDALLKKAPPDRLLMNMNDILRIFYILLDKADPELDENMRSYISMKLSDATWGITPRTREYLHKMKTD